MKRLFFSVLALTLGAFVFWSCDKEEEIDNGKGKPAERGSFMTVQQQRDAFQDNINGIAQAIDFSDLSQAAEVVAEAAGKKWGLMSLMPILEDTVLTKDDEFALKLSNAIALAHGDFEAFEGTNMDLRPIYMYADVYVVDTIIYGDTIAALCVENFKADSTVDRLLLNVYIEDHVITLDAKIEPGSTEFDYTNVPKDITSTLALPQDVDITLTLDDKVLVDIESYFISDYTVSCTSDGDDNSWVIEGSKSLGEGIAKIAGYEVDGKLEFDDAVGAEGSFTAKHGTTELLSCNVKMDATMTGVDMTDTAQVLAWAQNPEKLKAISMGASVRGGKIVFKLNAENPFKDEELARILRSQMMPGAKLTEEQEAKMVERINEVVDGGFYFEGFKEPQAKLKFVYREIADKAKPITENEKITGVVGADVIDAISEVFFKGGAYTMLTVRDDEGYEKDIQLEEYFSGISVETLTQTVIQKALEAFGPVIAQFAGDEGQEE